MVKCSKKTVWIAARLTILDIIKNLIQYWEPISVDKPLAIGQNILMSFS